MLMRRIVFKIDGRELATYDGSPPPEGREIYLENVLTDTAARYRVARVVECFGDSMAHTSVGAQIAGKAFDTVPGPVEVHLELIGA